VGRAGVGVAASPFWRRGVFGEGAGARVRAGGRQTEAGIKTYLTLGFGQGAARGGWVGDRGLLR